MSLGTSSLFTFLMQSAPSLVEEGIAIWLVRLFLISLISILLFLIFPRFRRELLLSVSFVYGTWFLGIKLELCLIVFASLWFLLLKFSDHASPPQRKKIFLWVIVGGSSLLYFGLMNVYRLGWSLPKPSVQAMGLSYLYLRVIHVSVDWVEGRLDRPTLLGFFLYSFYFPTMIWGPVERYQSFFQTPFFREESWRPHLDLYMVSRVLGGLLKIWVCATLLFLPYSELWDQTTTLPYSTLVKIFYLRAITFYLMASGSNDIGLMFSRMLKVPLAENYNYPYFRRNLAHFWRNWHISLSTILRDYVYEPLGGRRKHQRFNYILTFFFCAMWHVTSPAFVIWGLMHGLGMGGLRTWQDFWGVKAEKVPGIGRGLTRVRDFFRSYPHLGFGLSCLATFHFVALTWLPFWGGHPQGTIALLRLLRLDFLVGPISY